MPCLHAMELEEWFICLLLPGATTEQSFAYYQQVGKYDICIIDILLFHPNVQLAACISFGGCIALTDGGEETWTAGLPAFLFADFYAIT